MCSDCLLLRGLYVGKTRLAAHSCDFRIDAIILSAISHISLAMAVYNGERFIGEQLESLARQERLPDELVISDDGSSDRTVEIVRDFAARVPFPVRLLIHDQNVGCTKNYERAIRECSGEVIFLCDCD